MLKSLMYALLLLWSTVAFGQFRLSGIVRDSKSQELLAGATVQVTEAKTQVTDGKGAFSFDQLPRGNYSVRISFIGYTTETRTVEISDDLDLTIQLEQSAIYSEAVVVDATRASDRTPTTFTNVEKEVIQKQNFGQDLPILLNWTPSVVTTSDAGAGVGYTGIRIRGSDPTRINVTINGIPYNDSESLNTFWVNIPDIASSSQSIQVQRGVGTSTNGAGAFGATINLQTNTRREDRYGEIVNAYGSFNTRRHTFSFGSGLINERWIIEGRASRIASDGFIDRASADLSSYYFSTGYYSKNSMVKAIVFGGRERTYQAWYGVPESKLRNDEEAMLVTAGNEGWSDAQIANLLQSNRRTFNPYIYPNQVDNYQQDHLQLHYSTSLSSRLSLTSALHYTPGKGYFEEYRYHDALENYGLAPVLIGDSLISAVDLVRRRWLDNHFYGVTYSLTYDYKSLSTIMGGGWNRYDGDHFGEIIWSQVSVVAPEYQYYLNNADKQDFNIYWKTNYTIGNQLDAFIDLQYRRVTYEVKGIENQLRSVGVDASFNFFNPKIGLTYQASERNQLYASFAIANREPLRDDFLYDQSRKPKPETLRNIEAGIRNSGLRHALNANIYLMDYTNQLVLTGDVNDVGAPVRINAGESYRAGLEVDGLLKLGTRWQWNANLTLSRNRIREFNEVLQDYGDDFGTFPPVSVEVKRRNTQIALSPNVIAGSQLSWFFVDNAEVALLSKYVSRQFLDNTGDRSRSIDSYVTNDLRLSYSWKPKFMREINFSFLINNMFNELYESNGYTYGYLAGTAVFRENYYYPQAGRNFMGMVRIGI